MHKLDMVRDTRLGTRYVSLCETILFGYTGRSTIADYRNCFKFAKNVEKKFYNDCNGSRKARQKLSTKRSAVATSQGRFQPDPFLYGT